MGLRETEKGPLVTKALGVPKGLGEVLALRMVKKEKNAKARQIENKQALKIGQRKNLGNADVGKK